MGRRKIDPEIKDAVRAIFSQTNKTLKDIAEPYGISIPTVSAWCSDLSRPPKVVKKVDHSFNLESNRKVIENFKKRYASPNLEVSDTPQSQPD